MPKAAKVAKGCYELTKILKVAKSSQTFAPLDSTWLHMAQLASTGSGWVSLLEVGIPSKCYKHTKLQMDWMDGIGWDH